MNGFLDAGAAPPSHILPMLLADDVVRPLYESIHPHLALGAIFGSTVLGWLDGTIVILWKFSLDNFWCSIGMELIGITSMLSPHRTTANSTGIIIVISTAGAISIDVLSIATLPRGRRRSRHQNTSTRVIKPLLSLAEG